MLKAELNSLKVKKINSASTKKDNYNTANAVTIKNKKFISGISTKNNNNKLDDISPQLNAKNNLNNINTNNSSFINIAQNNSIINGNNNNSIIISSNKTTSGNNPINNKRRLSNLSMSPISPNIKNFRDKRLSLSKENNSIKLDKNQNNKEISVSPIKRVKKNSISFSNTKQLKESLPFIIEEEREKQVNFQQNKLAEINEIEEERNELEKDLLDLEAYSNEGENISLCSSQDNEKESSEKQEEKETGVALDSIFGWDEADIADKRKSIRMSKRISSFNANLINSGNYHNNNNNNNNNLINIKNEDFSNNKKLLNISGISNNNSNNAYQNLNGSSNNAGLILQKLDSKVKDKNPVNRKNSKLNNGEAANNISNTNINNNNNIFSNVKPRGKLSILYNAQGVFNEREKEKEKPKKESVVQQIAFNMKINIKQKKNNFNFNNYIKQLKDNEKVQKTAEIVSKKYKMVKDANTKQKQIICNSL